MDPPPDDEDDRDEPDTEPLDSDDELSDADAQLILDYLSNRLDPDEIQELEGRARRDKEFRYKLADIILLKGLVMLAIGKPASSIKEECRLAQRMFLPYLQDRTNPQKTAKLSQHLEDCFVCELAFERFRENPSRPGPWQQRRGRWRALLDGPRRRVLIWAASGIILAGIGTWGLVAFLPSRGGHAPAASSAAGPLASPGSAQTDGLLLRPEDITAALGRLLNADPSIDQDGKLSDLVHQLVDPTATTFERSDLYVKLGKEFGKRVEPLLWVATANEPDEAARSFIHRAIDLKNTADVPSLLATARREVALNSQEVPRLVGALGAHRDETARDWVRTLLASHQPADSTWWLAAFQATHRQMKGDPFVEARLKALLSDTNDYARSIAALLAADDGAPAGLSVAADLLESGDSKARANAVLVFRRHATLDDFQKTIGRPLAADAKAGLEDAMRSRGFVPSKNP